MFEPLTSNFNKPLTKRVKPRLKEIVVIETRAHIWDPHRGCYAYRSGAYSTYVCACDKVSAKGRTPEGAYKNWQSLREEVK